MRVSRYEEKYKTIWNEFIRASNNGFLIHEREFMEYHKHRFSDSSLMLIDDSEKIVAVLPGNIDGSSFHSHQGLTYGSLLWKQRVKSVEANAAYKALKSFSRDKFNKMTLKLAPNSFYYRNKSFDQYFLNQIEAKISECSLTTVLSLNSHKYSKGKRYNISKARKANITVEEIDRSEIIWEIVEKVLADQHNIKPVHSQSEIQYLKELFPNNIKFYGARLSNSIVSVAVLFIYRNIIHTQYLAVGKPGREIGALDFLLDQIIEKYRSTYDYISFGISTENNGKILNDGLITQKENFGAESEALLTYEVSS